MKGWPYPIETPPGRQCREHDLDRRIAEHRCTGACSVSLCDCEPEGASAVTEFVEPARPKPPAYPWRALGIGALVMFLAVIGVHVALRIWPPAQVVATAAS